MQNIRLGRPTITEESRQLVNKCLEEGRVSEGRVTERLEAELALRVGKKFAVVTSSGHAALVIAYRAMKDFSLLEKIVTTPITFISTVSAAMEVGLDVVCVDTLPDSFLMDPEQAMKAVDGKSLYVPVHLFGLEVLSAPEERLHGAPTVQDCCEAFGTKLKNRHSNSINCYSFYTSHVLGCGEMGFAATDDGEMADYMRQLKDQGRAVLRQPDHIERAQDASAFYHRYRHAVVGYNFRTTDIQAALILGSLNEMPRVIERRQQIVTRYRDAIGYRLPGISRGVSFLGYPIIFKSKTQRDSAVCLLESGGIETRPIMSLIPKEEAIRKSKSAVWTPFGYENAEHVHDCGLYISCHDSMTEDEVNYVCGFLNRVAGGIL